MDERRCSAPSLKITLLAVVLIGCATAPGNREPGVEAEGAGVPWVRESVEYKATALQAYRSAADALEALVTNPAWSALPQQTDGADLPTAVILDVDETVLDNVVYQDRQGARFDRFTWDLWLAEREATAVPGAVEFLNRTRALGVETFFVTNRPCRTRPVSADPCPQEQDTIANMLALGIEVDREHMLLLNERPDWGREKLTRRQALAKDYRIVMLFGDQLGDFVPCARSRIVPPCVEAATTNSRLALYRQHSDYWGNGWYMLPNPMYGTWRDFD